MTGVAYIGLYTKIDVKQLTDIKPSNERKLIIDRLFSSEIQNLDYIFCLAQLTPCQKGRDTICHIMFLFFFDSLLYFSKKSHSNESFLLGFRWFNS